MPIERQTVIVVFVVCAPKRFIERALITLMDAPLDLIASTSHLINIKIDRV